MLMHTDAEQGPFLNIVVGIIGAVLGGWLIAPLVGAGPPGSTLRAANDTRPAVRWFAQGVSYVTAPCSATATLTGPPRPR